MKLCSARRTVIALAALVMPLAAIAAQTDGGAALGATVEQAPGSASSDTFAPGPDTQAQLPPAQQPGITPNDPPGASTQAPFSGGQTWDQRTPQGGFMDRPEDRAQAAPFESPLDPTQPRQRQPGVPDTGWGTQAPSPQQAPQAGSGMSQPSQSGPGSTWSDNNPAGAMGQNGSAGPGSTWENEQPGGRQRNVLP